MVKSTFYESANHAVQMAARLGTGLFTVDLGVQRIPQQGFVNARMDMTSNRATSVNGRYENDFRWGSLDARVYYAHTTHQMNILRDKIPGMNMPMDTDGTSLGYSIKADVPLSPRDVLRVGSELQRSALDDWWPPASTTVGSMGPDTLWNINNGRRSRLGTYGEWESKRRDTWTTLLGVRSDIVRMNTGNVSRLQHVDDDHGKRGVLRRCRRIQRGRPRAGRQQPRPDGAHPLRAGVHRQLRDRVRPEDAFAQPVRAVPLGEAEQHVGADERLVRRRQRLHRQHRPVAGAGRHAERHGRLARRDRRATAS